MSNRLKELEALRQKDVPHSLETVKGYPDRLQIYKRGTSPHWYVRVYAAGRYKRKAIGTPDRKAAQEFAKAFYDDVLKLEREDKSLFPNSFVSIAKEYLDQAEKRAMNGVISKRKFIEERKKLNADIIPFFGNTNIDDIDEMQLDGYLDDVLYTRDLSSSTIKKHFVTINQVLKYAKKYKKIKFIPDMPKIKSNEKPRPWFDEDEFKLLWEKAKEWAAEKHKYLIVTNGKPERILYYNEEFFDFILFSANVFVRLSDIKDLKHKHVKIITQNDSVGLEILPPKSKTITRTSVSMPTAVKMYKKLVARHNKEGIPTGRDDYIFYPKFENRAYALQNLGRLFNHLLEELDLKYNALDNRRTLYSLRHTAIMFRCLHMEHQDIHFLAKNALTSVEMLEKHYLSHLSSKMKMEDFQKTKKGKSH